MSVPKGHMIWFKDKVNLFQLMRFSVKWHEKRSKVLRAQNVALRPFSQRKAFTPTLFFIHSFFSGNRLRILYYHIVSIDRYLCQQLNQYFNTNLHVILDFQTSILLIHDDYKTSPNISCLISYVLIQQSKRSSFAFDALLSLNLENFWQQQQAQSTDSRERCSEVAKKHEPLNRQHDH